MNGNWKKVEQQQQQQQQNVMRRRSVCGGRGTESALYEVVCPVWYVVRVFGLAPYAYPKGNQPPRLRASRIYCLYSLLWASIYSWVVVTVLMRFGGLDRDKPVLGVTENGKLILNYVSTMAELCLTVSNREKFVHVWNGIQDFDESFQLGYADLERRRLPAILRRVKLLVWLSIAGSFVAWTAINQLGMHAFDEPYLQNVGYMIIYVGAYIATFKFIGLVFLLGQRFAHLNRLLASHTRMRNTRNHHDHNDAFAKKIETWYNNLLDTSEKLNEVYSVSLFLFLLNLFCHAVSNMYFFTIWTIVDPSYLEDYTVVLCLFTWLLVYLLQLLLLHVSCHSTSAEANRMANVLLDWRRHVERHQSKQHVGNRSNLMYPFARSTLHYLNRRLKFTAAGCFDVNLPVLTTTFGHLTIYLVILLQIPDSGT